MAYRGHIENGAVVWDERADREEGTAVTVEPAKPDQAMKMIEKEQAKDSLGDYVGRLQDEPLVIIDHGEPIAALLPLNNADLETVSLSTNPRFIELIERSRRRHSTEGGISSKEMRQRLDMDIV